MTEPTLCRIAVQGRAAYLTLDRTAALNALNLDMIEAIHAAMDSALADPSVALIVLQSASDKAFCAGGDMKHIRSLSLEGDFDAISSFFTREYQLNLRLALSPKPVIALIDGIAMGGGLGLSVHGAFTVVSERARLAMPESRIGFFPDVGGSFFLPKLTDRAGYWMALTAASLGGASAVAVGLASHFIPAQSFDTVRGLLEDSQAGAPDTILAAHSLAPDQAAACCANDLTDERRDRRAQWFAGNDVETIRAALDTAASGHSNSTQADAQALLAALDTASPHTVETAFALFTEGQGQSLEVCLDNELRQAAISCRHPDFIEGVRAVLVDKDRQANWRRA